MAAGSKRTSRRLVQAGLALVLALQIAVAAAPGAKAGITYYTPMLYLTPTCLPDASVTSITVKGRNFNSNQQFYVYDEYSTGSYDGDVVRADEWGNFTSVIPVVALDHHTIWTSEYGGADLTFAYIELCPPSIKATPQCSDSGAGPISINGIGWHAGISANIQVQILDSGGAPVYTKSRSAASSFTMSLSPPSPVLGDEYSIVATQSYAGDSGTPAFNNSDRVYFTVPCPTVSVSPTCGVTGSTDNAPLSITVTVANFVEGFGRLEIVYDPTGHPQEWITDLSEDGSYVITPYRRSQGVYTVLVKQGWDRYGNTRDGTSLVLEQAVTYFAEPCGLATPTPLPTPSPTPPPTAPPTASPSPTPSPAPSPTSAVYHPTVALDVACGAPQLVNDLPQYYYITVTGSGFAPGAVDITFDNGGVPQAFAAAADFSGALTTVIMPAAAADGLHRVVIHQNVVGGLPLQVEAPFSVPCSLPAPVITSDITCGPVAAGLPAAYLINLSGTGFFPGRVDIQFDALGLLPETTFVSADPQGTWVAALTPNGRAPGMYQVVARQVVYGTGTAVEASLPFTVACDGPQFRLQPDMGPPGLVITVSGAGFPPDADLLLRWSRGIAASHPVPVRTDAAGSFSRQVLIFYGDFGGLRELSVEQASDPLALALLPPATFLVLARTVSPPLALDGNPLAAPDATIVLRH